MRRRLVPLGPLQRAQAQTKPNIVSQAAPPRWDQLPARKAQVSHWLALACRIWEAVSAMRRLPFTGPPFSRRPKGWTAETSARAAKPETQIDGHTRPGSTGGADSRRLHRSCLGWWARGGRGWWRRSSGIQPHDTNHHLFSALWNQCMEHCASIAPRTAPVFF